MNPKPAYFSAYVMFAIGFGALILLISLLSASRVSISGSLRFSEELRIRGEILPGHVLYPFMAISERFELVTTARSQQCDKRLGLAKTRREQAVKLLEINEPHSALETIVKSQSYVANAEDYCRDVNHQGFIDEVQIQMQLFQQVKNRYGDEDRAIIDRLVTSHQALL